MMPEAANQMDVGYSSTTRARVIELMLAAPGSDRVNWYLDHLKVGSESVIFLSEEAPTDLVRYCSWAGREPEGSEGNQGSRYTQSLTRLYTYNYGLNNVLVAPVVSKSSASITVRLNFGRFKPVGIFQDGQRLDRMDTLELELRYICIDPFNRNHHGPFARSGQRPNLSYDSADAWWKLAVPRHSHYSTHKINDLADYVYELGPNEVWVIELSRSQVMYELACQDLFRMDHSAMSALTKVALGYDLRSQQSMALPDLPVDTILSVLMRDHFMCSHCRNAASLRYDDHALRLHVLPRHRLGKKASRLAVNLTTMCESCASNHASNIHSQSMTQRSVPPKLRWQVLTRDSFTCRYCGRSIQKEAGLILEVDHVIPWAKGGETVPENLVTACHECNSGKSDSSLS